MHTSISLKKSIVQSIFATIVMLVLYGLTQMGKMGPNPVGQSASYQSPLIVPAGYAFAIWSIIYLGIIAFPIYQWFYRKEGHPIWQEINSWFAVNVILNGIWLVFASYNWLWLSVVTIIFMLVTLYRINDLLIEINHSDERINFWLERAVFSIYFAWITLATALNVSAALQYNNWSGMGLSQQLWALIILPVTGLIAAFVFKKYRDGFYASVVVWAFVALVVRHLNSDPTIAYLAVGIATIFALLIIFKRKKILT